MSSDLSTLNSLSQWNDDSFYIKEFVKKFELPQIVRPTKGSYSVLSNSSTSAYLLLSFGIQKRIAAQCIKFKDSNRKIIGVGPKLAIPGNYPGYFEILSEEGRSVRPIESVDELIKRFPDSVLVRENIRAFYSPKEEIDEEDELRIRSKPTRIVLPGETIILLGEVTEVPSSSASSDSSTSSNYASVSAKPPARFLRCLDSRSRNLWLPAEIKGKFSPIAKADAISGVHSPNNLFSKRMPMMTRLAHGPRPPIGLKSSQSFLSEMRLLAELSEEVLGLLPLAGKDAGVLIPLPISANLKLQGTCNFEALKSTAEFSRVHSKAKDFGGDLSNKIVVHDVSTVRDIRLNGPDLKSAKNLSPTVQSAPPPPGGRLGDDYDEIEQIYDYVRGLAPLPKATTKRWKQEEAPDPPPLETLPSRSTKVTTHAGVTGDIAPSASWSEHKRSSKSSNENKQPEGGFLPNRYAKSASYHQRQTGQKYKLFRKKDYESGGIKPSPLFHFRYKSLNNIPGEVSYGGHTEYNNTLNSSHSGGKGSGNSADSGRNLPEKRSRKLMRPKSLTNLVWGGPPVNSLIKPPNVGTKKIGSTDSSKIHIRDYNRKLGSAGSKRLGTLYL